MASFVKVHLVDDILVVWATGAVIKSVVISFPTADIANHVIRVAKSEVDSLKYMVDKRDYVEFYDEIDDCKDTKIVHLHEDLVDSECVTVYFKLPGEDVMNHVLRVAKSEIIAYQSMLQNACAEAHKELFEYFESLD